MVHGVAPERVATGGYKQNVWLSDFDTVLITMCHIEGKNKTNTKKRKKIKTRKGTIQKREREREQAVMTFSSFQWPKRESKNPTNPSQPLQGSGRLIFLKCILAIWLMTCCKHLYSFLYGGNFQASLFYLYRFCTVINRYKHTNKQTNKQTDKRQKKSIRFFKKPNKKNKYKSTQAP